MTENILVIKLSALGDFIQSLSAMKAIRAHYKNAHITLLTTKPFKEFAEASGYFDDVLVDPRPKIWDVESLQNLMAMLRRKEYSQVFDLQNNGRVARYKYFLKGDPQWHSILNKGEKKTHALPRHRAILARAGITDVPIDTMDWLGTDISSFGLPEKYALIVPGCTPTRPEKKWPAERYAALATLFVEQGVIPVVLGTKDEQKEADIILSSCGAAISFIGQTKLFDIPALAHHAVCAVGNDTGPMHMIGPTGCKSLVLFSYSSDPELHAPVGENVTTIREEDLGMVRVEDVWQSLKLFI